jgi:ferredoxin hydrogenase
MSKHQFAEIRIPIEKDNPAIMRHEERCVKCGACRRVCETDAAVGGMYDLAKTGDMPICIHCGQCANVCPADSITEQYEYRQVKEAIADPEKVVIFSTSPSVRVAIGEAFGYKPGTFLQGKMVAALRALGADSVLDTNFGADLTIMEEAAELAELVKQEAASGERKTRRLPQFTSCCPAWVKFAETFYPEFLSHLSTAKSPIGMQGPTIKTWFAKRRGIDPRRIVNVAVTPCTAKKFEIRREEMADAGKLLNIPGLRDMDHVITTRELALWLQEEGIDFKKLSSSDYDPLMGSASGAGIIFGNTGGVMEAAARTVWYKITGENPPDSFFALKEVRGLEGIKTTTLHINDITLSLAVVHGMNNARTLIEELKKGDRYYDFIEVMACPGGCIGGGGQPKTTIPITAEILRKRIDGLYARDRNLPPGTQAAVSLRNAKPSIPPAPLRCSHDNPEIQKLYESFYTKPLSPLAEQLLHTGYQNRSADLTAGSLLEDFMPPC